MPGTDVVFRDNLKRGCSPVPSDDDGVMEDGESSSNVLAIVLATVGTLLFLTLALVGLYCYKKK